MGFGTTQLILILIAVPIYFFPAILGRQKNNFRSIFLFNLLLGWTLVGWVIALRRALSKEVLPVYLNKTPSVSEGVTMALSLNFKQFSLDGKFHIGMINRYLRHQPEKILYKTNVKNWTEKNWTEKIHKKVIEEFSSDAEFIFISPGGNSFSINAVQAVKKPYQHFFISQSSAVFNPADQEMEEIITREGFCCAYLYDEKYERQQTSSKEAYYEVFGVPLSLSKGLPYTIDEFGQKVFDTSGNPGRSEMISSARLQACWKMWFGEEFYHVVPKERLLSFEGAFKIAQLANDVVFVQLYEYVEDSITRQAQEIQWAWRKWLDFDDLVKRFP